MACTGEGKNESRIDVDNQERWDKFMRKCTILCVNDEKNILSALKRVFLGEDNYEIITANGGEEALEILKKKPINLIITDLYMPGIDGWKLCRLLRSPEFHDYNSIPILVMSATFSGSDTEEITRDLGANGFISVPYTSKDLVCAVENLLSGKVLSKTVRVLIVEDDESLRRTICDCFKEYGYSIFEASDVNQALNQLKNVNPEIIILDYHLPDHTGDTLLQRLKVLQSQAAVLVITGDASPDLAIKITKMGADGYVRKPFKSQYLLDLCEKIRREWSLLRVEKLLEDRTQEFQRIFENSVDGIIIFDSSGCIVQVNNAVEKLLGSGREKVVGKNIRELMPEDEENTKKAMELMRDLKKQDKISGVEQLWKRNDGSLFYVELNFSVVRDARSNLTGAVVSIRDITERKQSEEEVRKTKDFLESVIEGSKDGIITVDEKGNILSCNTAMEKISGFNKKELVGRHASSLVVEDKEIRGYLREKAAELYEKGFATYEATYSAKDGKSVVVDCTSSMIKNEKGDYIAGVSILRDVTERKEMEHKLLQSEKLKSLGELAGGVAHNFNNALAVILGRAQLLKINIGPPPDKGERRKSIIELKKGLETIEKASLDGAETVRRIQEFSRRRDDDRYFTSVDMNNIIDDALEFTKLNWKNGAESKGIKINIKKELSTLPSVSGSAAELREVLTNIINNAIFAMPQGGTITVKTFRKGGYACITVQDTGMGIPEAIRDRIFDPFFTTKGPQSSGLGMSVSYGIIERHRGTISVDSPEGKGTTFTIEIPFSEKTAEEGKVVPISSGQKKVNILIVEDEEDVRNVLKDVLTHEGHRVETASNGKLGIEKFKKKNFDIVLTDLGMPGMSGWQVAEKIKAINGKIPIVLITGWSIDLKESEMREKGIDFIMKKPYKLDQLVNVVQEGMMLRDQLKAV